MCEAEVEERLQSFDGCLRDDHAGSPGLAAKSAIASGWVTPPKRPLWGGKPLHKAGACHQLMELRITATELARRLGDVLGKIRFRGDAFIVERNGEPVARIGPIPVRTAAPLIEGLRSWGEASPADPSFADDLERVGLADQPPVNPRAS